MADLMVAMEFAKRIAGWVTRGRLSVEPGRVSRLSTITFDWPSAGGRTLAVIPTRNQGGLLRRCLESLFRTRGEVPLDIVVIDHESDEAEARDYLRAISGLVTVMPYAGPFDFSRMNNLAVARYGGRRRRCCS